ncbi:MAG: carbohydrate-binding protein [Eubacterium sp.]|nr:carbohydrate-binding protein [Eubacterium sp.]
MKAKSVIKKVFVAIIAVLIAILFVAGGFFIFYKPMIIFDANDLTGDVMHGATGFLYGIAEDGVPSYNMVESINMTSLSTKTQGGLQHPIGEVGDVANEANVGGSLDYLIVYLQDMYSTWYYEHQAITDMKQAGTYDWKEYIQKEFFPLIKKTVTEIKASDYHDKIVYCIYNECDNAIWFGTWVPTEDGGGWNAFDDAGKQNFYEGWKMTYDYVRSLDPDALIGGPGYMDYDTSEMDGFLKYASENDCVPDVMIYHELNEMYSIYNWQVNVSELRAMEESYGISADTPIIVTEYGIMADNGNPNNMSKYIAQIENSKVYGDQAYWLLANNLCNTAADYNTPNSAWWVYRWYADMVGQTMNYRMHDMFHADFKNAIRDKRPFRYKKFLGVGSITDEKDEIRILASGADYSGALKVNNLKQTALYGKKVCVTISAMTYQGISGKVYEPEIVKTYTTRCGNSITVNLDDMNSDTAYYVEIREAEDLDTAFDNKNLYTRYEFEHGTLLGNAYTYQSAYATTGEISGMVGGMENEGDGVEIQVRIPDDGSYDFTFIYGNSNDGPTSDDRTFTYVNLSIDGEESVIALENTIRSELTASMTMTLDLTDGRHTIRLTHNDGTYVLDSLLVRKTPTNSKISVIKDYDRTTDSVTSFLAVSPYDGYFDVVTLKNTEISVDGAPAVTELDGKATVFLRRGLNYIDVSSADNVKLTVKPSVKSAYQIVLSPDEATLSGTAYLDASNAAKTSFIGGISSNGGSAVYNVSIPESGTYKMTVLYSNNDENGVHDYNIDLVEDFITVSANGKTQEIYCRNTYSWDTFTTVTFNIDLVKGNNVITFSNDGFNKFNGNETFAPHIADVTISETQV